MLIMQNVVLTWHKEERGGAFAAARSDFPLAYRIDKITLNKDNIILYNLYYYQEGKRFLNSIEYNRLFWEKIINNKSLPITQDEAEKRIIEDKMRIKSNAFSVYSDVSELNIKNIKLLQNGSECLVDFYYDIHKSGAPARRGRNKDYNNPSSRLFGKNILNETAFTLELGQIGRIVYNERLTDYDTRE